MNLVHAFYKPNLYYEVGDMRNAAQIQDIQLLNKQIQVMVIR